MQTSKKIDPTASDSTQGGIIIRSIAKIALILLAFVPLLVDGNVIFPYISEKMIVVRAAIALVLLLISLNLFISKYFRKELYSKVKRLIRNPIFITTGAFIFSIALSVVFAVDKYRAFFGNVERAEGFIGIACYVAFLPLAYLLFSRKDWVWFFKANLLTGLVLFINEVMSIPADSTAVRPGSFTGNSSFLAGYFLFVILSALIVIYNSRKEEPAFRLLWQISSSLMVLLSIIGIFLTQTRGTILGLGAGLILLAIYWITKGGNVALYKKISLRRASSILILLLVVFSVFFVVTGKDAFWQKVPGMNRFSQLDLEHITNDATIQTRLISTGIGLKAISPAINGPMHFIFGWGQENFDVAYNINYNPKYFEFEQQWFDRAHDKIIDVLVMNGVLGLFTYLAMWCSFMWVGFKKKGFSFERMSVLFFGVAFFVNTISLFDQISTYIPVFAALGFMAYLYDEEHHRDVEDLPNGVPAYVLYTAVGVASVFFIYVFSISLVAYSQMSGYVGLLKSSNLTTIENGIGGVTSPYSYAQQDIRGDLVSEIVGQYATSSSPELKPFLDQAIGYEEQVISLDPHDPRQSLIIAEAYDAEGKVAMELSNSAEGTADFQKAEKYYRFAYQLAPLRQDVILPLAQNLLYQGKIGDALTLLQNCYNEDPKVVMSNYEFGMVLSYAGTKYYSQSLPLLNLALEAYANNLSALVGSGSLAGVYKAFASYFYQTKDLANFVLTMDGLKILESYNSSNIDAAISAVKSGNWSAAGKISL